MNTHIFSAFYKFQPIFFLLERKDFCSLGIFFRKIIYFNEILQGNIQFQTNI